MWPLNRKLLIIFCFPTMLAIMACGSTSVIPAAVEPTPAKSLPTNTRLPTYTAIPNSTVVPIPTNKPLPTNALMPTTIPKRTYVNQSIVVTATLIPTPTRPIPTATPNIDERLSRAYQIFTQGGYGIAVFEYTEIINLEPTRWAAYWMRAQTYSELRAVSYTHLTLPTILLV